MLASAIAQKVIDQGLSLGANFVDIFVEEHQTSTIQLLSSDVNEINAGVDFGIGVRLIYDGDVVYGYTNSTRIEDLLEPTINQLVTYGRHFRNL